MGRGGAGIVRPRGLDESAAERGKPRDAVARSREIMDEEAAALKALINNRRNRETGGRK